SGVNKKFGLNARIRILGRSGNERYGSAGYYRTEERRQGVYRHLSRLAIAFLFAASREGAGASQLGWRLSLDQQAHGDFSQRRSVGFHVATRDPLQLESCSQREGAKKLRGFGG